MLYKKASYERDSVLFYKKEYSYHLISFLLKAYIEDGELNVLDFGGALESSFFQNRDMLIDNIKNLNWYTVEQDNFVIYEENRK